MNKILIVDDEYGLADIVAEILGESGYEVSLAINGKLGLLQMAMQKPDLVLLDLMMPVLDGQGMLLSMRANPEYREIPVIMMTALLEALPQGEPLYQAALRKPFSQELLLETISRLLGANSLP